MTSTYGSTGGWRRLVHGALAAALSWCAVTSSSGTRVRFRRRRGPRQAARRQRLPETRRATPQGAAEPGDDQYWNIRYKPDKAFWRAAKLPFEVSFLHQGMYYDQPVRINEVTPDGVQEIKFDPKAFDDGVHQAGPGSAAATSGLAGFRVRYGANPIDSKDEVLTVLGASYFRALGKGQNYGSAAGPGDGHRPHLRRGIPAL